MATVYDGNRIGILPGGTTYGALASTTLVAATPTALAAANTARVSIMLHNATGDWLYVCFSDSTGLSSSLFAMKIPTGSTLNVTGAEAQAALYGYSVGGGNVYMQTALA